MSPEQKSNPSNLSTARLLLAAVILISFATVFGVAKYLALNKPVINPEPVVSSAPDLPATPTPEIISNRNDSIDNWQTYRNEEYGFEVKYPKDWFENEKWPGRQAGISEKERSIIISFAENQEDLFYEKGMNIFISPPNDSLWNLYIRAENAICKSEKVPEKNIQNLIKEKAINNYCDTGKEFYFSTFDGKIFKLYSTAEIDKTFDQILSTFKFINPCEGQTEGEQLNCFISYLSQNPLSSDMVETDDKLEKYFSENLNDLKFTGISRGKFDKFYDKNMILVSMDWNAGMYGKSFIFILKENFKKSWDVQLVETGDYIRFVNKPEKLIKNEEAFFIGQDTRSGGTCTSVSWKNIIYKLENGKFENIWSTDFYFVDQGEQPEFPAKINDKTNTTVIDTELSFKDTNGDDNKEIIRQGIKKIWKGYCNGGEDEDVVKIEKIYEVYKWNSRKQTFILSK